MLKTTPPWWWLASHKLVLLWNQAPRRISRKVGIRGSGAWSPLTLGPCGSAGSGSLVVAKLRRLAPHPAFALHPTPPPNVKSSSVIEFNHMRSQLFLLRSRQMRSTAAETLSSRLSSRPSPSCLASNRRHCSSATVPPTQLVGSPKSASSLKSWLRCPAPRLALAPLAAPARASPPPSPATHPRLAPLAPRWHALSSPRWLVLPPRPPPMAETRRSTAPMCLEPKTARAQITHAHTHTHTHTRRPRIPDASGCSPSHAT